MRKIIYIFSFLIISKTVFSQEKTTVKKEKDSIKTEIINVITSYTPTISDAFKIKKNPRIKLGSKMQKRKLQYQIFSAPVASSFVPKTGIVKGMNMGKKERVYNNYLAAGFGNNTTPFLETFLHHSTRVENDFGLYAKYLSSKNNINTTPLNTDFSNLTVGIYYKQTERSYRWEIGGDYTQNSYNWYGLPASSFTFFTPTTTINEQQIYSNFDTHGKITFENSILNTTTLNLAFFSDSSNSKELRFIIQPQFQFSLKGFGRNFNDLIIDTSINYLNGEFPKTYTNSNSAKLEHSFFTIEVAPKYSFKYNDFSIKLGTKIVYNSDLENQIYQFYIYPDINISYPIITNIMNLYLGANGGLKTNSYKDFVSENPFISPTQFITQTNEKYNVFGGFNGKITSNVNYDIKASYKSEDDKALFIRNNSKFDGSNSATISGYEFGNSFSVFYDAVKTFSLFAEFTIDVSKNLTIGANGQFNSFTLTKYTEAWNIPKTRAEILGNYKFEKWYAGANLLFVGERKDIFYSGTFPSTIAGVQNLKSYFDVNIHGGYHINNQFTAFLKINNLLNSQYQRFSNFYVQGFQILGGVSYKFDF